VIASLRIIALAMLASAAFGWAAARIHLALLPVSN
jgi:hypothetical protein